ncbi:SocA family protein [Patescibacteria group bacterium]|nr:SocA family protein [Patescibacteria group bacterium]MBU1457239.1 SocA family protein [Patescibacteria group bacterium]
MSKKKKLSPQDLILYILQKIEPEKSDKIRLNKIAFFVEFGYYHKKQSELSRTKFAGIKLGPVINQYAEILESMEKSGKIKIDGYKVRPLISSSVQLTNEVRNTIDPIIVKYSRLSNSELVALSHLTDSYKITTDNEKDMGNIIDKELASLESFFDDELPSETSKLDDRLLPKINKSDLVKYAT